MTIMDRVSDQYEKEAKNCNSWCRRRTERTVFDCLSPHICWFLLGLLFITFVCASAQGDATVPTGSGLTKRKDIFFNNSMSVCVKHQRVERDTWADGTTTRLKKLRDAKRIKPLVIDDRADIDDDDVDLEHHVTVEAFRDSPSVIGEEGKQPLQISGEKCLLREEIRKISLEMIKEDILSKLGMAQPPNLAGRMKPGANEFGMTRLLQKYEFETKDRHHHYPSRRHSHHAASGGVHWVFPNDDAQMQGDAPAPSERGFSHRDTSDKSNSVRSHVNNSDNRYSDTSFPEGEVYMEEEDDFHVRTEKVVAFSLPHPKLRHVSPHVQYFHFSDKARANRVKRAVLWIFIRGRDYPGISGNMVNITIYRTLRSGQQQSGRGNESPVLTSIISGLMEPLPPAHGAWISLEYGELERMVGEWFRTPQANLGIIISATDRLGNNLAVIANPQMDSAVNVPFLEVYVTDIKKHRTKRTLGLNCNENSNETRCCRYPLTVDFEEFGWDWVIAPKKYEANFCAGECPMVFMPRYPHTTLVQLTNLHRSRAGPCCAPRKLSSISMLYFDNQMNVMYGTLPSMVVDRCGCS